MGTVTLNVSPYLGWNIKITMMMIINSVFLDRDLLNFSFLSLKSYVIYCVYRIKQS